MHVCVSIDTYLRHLLLSKVLTDWIYHGSHKCINSFNIPVVRVSKDAPWCSFKYGYNVWIRWCARNCMSRFTVQTTLHLKMSALKLISSRKMEATSNAAPVFVIHNKLYPIKIHISLSDYGIVTPSLSTIFLMTTSHYLSRGCQIVIW